MLINFITFLFFLVLSACFEVAETALFVASDVRIQILLQKGDERAKIVQKLRNNKRKLISTLLLCMTFCDIAATSIATVMATYYFDDAAVGIAIGVMTLVVLIFVRILPKSYAIRHPEQWSLFFARPVSFLIFIFTPFVILVNAVVNPFLKQWGAAMHTISSEEEIKTIASLGAKTGTLGTEEKELIDRVFLFNNITASDVLTPKEVMLSLDGERTIDEILPIVITAKFSRFPVYLGNDDNIIGIIHIKNIFEKITGTSSSTKTIKIKDIITPAFFVSETELIDVLFRTFKKMRTHMAIVLNNQQTVVGLVTLEDLLEELVGEISDESDIDEHIIKRIDKYTVLVHGDIEIADVNRFFNTKIDASEERTIGRLLTKINKKTPSTHQQIELAKDVFATIEHVSHRRILRVKLKKT